MKLKKTLVIILIGLSTTNSFGQVFACVAPLRNIDWVADNLRWDGEIGCLYDYDNIDKCDWRLEREDIKEFSIGQRDFRIETWLQSHLTGSGSGRTLVIYECTQAKLRQIFNQGIRGLRQLPIVEDRRIRLKLLLSQPGDPMCCPSKESEKILSWDPGKETFK